MTVSAQHLLYILHETKCRTTSGQCPAAGSFFVLVGLESFPLTQDRCPLLALTLLEDGAHIALFIPLGSFHERHGVALAHGSEGVKDRRTNYTTRCVLKRENHYVLSSCEK